MGSPHIDQFEIEGLRKILDQGVLELAWHAKVLDDVLEICEFGLNMEDIAKSQSLKTSFQGFEFVQATGCFDAVKDPRFWNDWGSGQLTKQKLMKRWVSRQEEADAAERARLDREFRESMRKVKKVWREWDLDLHRAEQSRREQARLLNNTRRSRPPTPNRPTGTVPLEEPAIVHQRRAAGWRRVRLAGREGEYIILFYPGSSEVFFEDKGKWVLVSPRKKNNWYVVEGGPVPKVRPGIVSQPPGPIGKNPIVDEMMKSGSLGRWGKRSPKQ